MLRYFFAFLALAMVAAIFGYGAVGDYSWPGARTFCFVFLALAGLTFVVGGGFGRRAA